jgi:hypothetical protein
MITAAADAYDAGSFKEARGTPTNVTSGPNNSSTPR